MLHDARHAAPHHHFGHRVIILNRGSMPHAREQKENDANFPDQDVQRHSMTSHGTERLLVNDPSGGGLRGNSAGNCRVSYLSFVYGSTGRVCGRSLTVGKILFTGMQTCSLYLVLWHCDFGVMRHSVLRPLEECRLRRSLCLDSVVSGRAWVAVCVSRYKSW